MPVTKYRSVADMPPLTPAVESSLVERIRTLWRRAFLLSPPSIPRGVARFRDMSDANDARDRATRQRMAKTRPPTA